MRKHGKKITDKMRLDFLERSKFDADHRSYGWQLWDGKELLPASKKLRQAIDAEMKRKAKP